MARINSWRIFAAKKRDGHDIIPQQQKRYHAYFTPMIIERRTLPIFKKAGFTPQRTRPIVRSAIECACCEICFLFYSHFLRKHSHNLIMCTFVRSAAVPTTGVALGALCLLKKRKLAANLKDTGKKFTKTTIGHPLLVPT